MFKGHLFPLTFQESSGLILTFFLFDQWPSARYRFWQEAAEPIYYFLMVSSVLWNFITSTVKPVHPEWRVSPPSLNESELFGVNGYDKVIFPALSWKGEISPAWSHSAPCHVYTYPLFLFHFSQESMHHSQKGVESSSIVQQIRETLENTVFYVFSLLAPHKLFKDLL